MTKILTSHVGSLPRSQEVVDFIFARENGVSYDESLFDKTMTNAVNETVKKQTCQLEPFSLTRSQSAHQTT